MKVFTMDKMTDAEIRVKIAQLEAQLAKMEGQARERRATEGLGREAVSFEDQAEITETQDKCDSILQMKGERAPRALEFENARSYRIRALQAIREHSSLHKGLNLRDASVRGSVLDTLEREIYADAQQRIKNELRQSEALVPITSTDDYGRRRTDYIGSPRAAFAPFISKSQRLTFPRMIAGKA